MAPRPRHGLVVACLLVLWAPALAGCLSEAPPGPATLERGDWQVGDRWTYLRRVGDVPPTVYAREVTGLFGEDGREVFELREGIIGGPVVQTNKYTVGRLLYAGGELREGLNVVQRVRPEAPIPFHYVFPLGHGDGAASGRFHQSAGGIDQLDTVEVETWSGARTTRTIDDRVYDGWPYRIDIRYTTTPLDDSATIHGFWSAAVGQSVETEIIEGDRRVHYTLLSFERADPDNGPPAYRLTNGLSTSRLDAGFDAPLDEPGHARWLFHVEWPRDVTIRFSFPPMAVHPDQARLDLATVRPLGYTRAGITDDVHEIAEPGVVMHLAAAQAGQRAVDFHAPAMDGPIDLHLEPGQVYELLLASNRGGMRAEVRLGDDVASRAPAEVGSADVVSVQHRRVHEVTAPGPQNFRDAVTASISLPPESRVEGLVYALNHGPADAVGEVAPARTVSYRVDASPFADAVAIYGFYHAYPATHPFEVEAAFEYRADLAVQGAVDYEVGALLMRLE